MGFLSALGGAGTAGAAGTAGTLTGFDKFMNLAAFASNPGMQEGFMFDKLLGNLESSGDIFEDISAYGQKRAESEMDEQNTLLNFFNALDSRKRRNQEEQDATKYTFP